jgi:hypothetical protein
MMENRFQRDPPREWYETGRDRESTMTNERRQSGEVWLRGNLRPVAWLAALAAVIAGVLSVTVAVAAASLSYSLLVATFSGVAGAVIGTLAYAAARPRLERVDNCLRVRLSPTIVEDVPLEAVECFFQGSNPIARSGEPTCGDHAAFRVNTLVMRLAERFADYAKRPTFTPWGTWDDGYVVFDGRWCEPLSADLAKQLSRRLIDAKRSLAEEQASEGQSLAGQASGNQSAGVGP